jgi:hypothetical protein
MNAITPTTINSATTPPTTPPIKAELSSDGGVVAGMAMTSVVVVLSIIDNVDIADIDVVVGELVCCVVLLVVVGIGVGGHVRGKQLVTQMCDAVAVEQSCWVDVNSRHKSLECGSPSNWYHLVFAIG